MLHGDEHFRPPHHILLRAPGPGTGPPVRFVPEAWPSEVRREWAEREIMVSGWLAGVLPLAVGESMVERSMRVFVGDVPMLTSSSYLPAGLTGDPHRWQDVEVGQLALAGCPARSTYVEHRWQMPTRGDAKALGIERGTPVLVMTRPYTLRADHGTTIPAGVLVLARSDLVYVRGESTSTT